MAKRVVTEVLRLKPYFSMDELGLGPAGAAAQLNTWPNDCLHESHSLRLANGKACPVVVGQMSSADPPDGQIAGPHCRIHRAPKQHCRVCRCPAKPVV